MTELKKIKIYTDGGSLENPGPGGYGIILKHKDRIKEISGGYKLTTNNRMELTAAIVALQALKEKCDITLYTDSKYVVDGITLGWAERWKRNGWKRNKKDKAENPDLWNKLLDLVAIHKIKFEWVKGHAGHPENERCDELVKLAANGHHLLVDEGYQNFGNENRLI
ncbi:MAG: ribonuclease HI [Ignavibacteriales bacterium]|nr:MAG: ribonuclease HI [Ignavibacteriales bacterium]